MKREELLTKRGYLIKKMQYDLFDAVNNYIEHTGINQTVFASKMHKSKGYISQIMNANVDHKLSTIVDLAICMEKVPTIQFQDIPVFLEMEKSERDWLELKPITQPLYAVTEHIFDDELLFNDQKTIIHFGQRERSYADTEGAV